MDLGAITALALDNKEIIGLLAAIATVIGALYRPTLDLIRVLPGVAWGLIRFGFLIVWSVIWPLYKLIVWAYTKFLSERVDRVFSRVFDWLERRETIKNAARQSTK